MSLAALGLGPAAAQDYSAGKTAAQLFQSDCTACHKSPAGLGKGKDQRSLRAFLREHYTTKDESAVALAAYLAGAGGGAAEAKQKGQGPAAGAGPNAAPKPRSAARGADGEPAPRASIDENASEDHASRPPAPHEGARVESDATVRKLNAYAAAGGEAKDTERLAAPVRTLESYAGAGSSAEAIAPAAGAANPKPAEKKKKNAAGAGASASAPAAPAASAAHAPSPRRPPAAVVERPAGNN